MEKLLNIPDDWYNKLKHIVESDYFKELSAFIKQRRSATAVFPHSNEVFRAFNETPFGKIRCVIIGMDPYPTHYNGEPVACGLAFAPRYKEFVPPSLRMIYKNLKDGLYKNDLDCPETLDFTSWAQQGVFLLNAALTVEHTRAGSHLKQWAPFTEAVIKAISDYSSGVIFCFWGKDAQQYRQFVNHSAHYVLLAPHPVSAVYKGGTWDCHHFEEVNEILKRNNGETIQWLSS